MILPDSGTIIAYRSSGGFGVRLDAGDGFQGEISPYYDSLLVKLSTHAVSFKQAEENGTKPEYESTKIPKISQKKINQLFGTKQILEQHGPTGVTNWVREQEDVLITDTTFRDAHQSLLATRVRTKDMMNIASKTAF